jgi:DNA-binding MarR family transcriptional regulator
MKDSGSSPTDRNRFNQIMHQLIGFAIKHRKIMQSYLDKTGVYQAQHHLLMEISHNQHASQKDLANSMEVSTATIAVSLKKLEKGGYINKVMDQEDNRLNQITITEKGNKVVEQSRRIFELTDQKVFEGFTEEETAALSALLQKLDANLARMEAEMKQAK